MTITEVTLIQVLPFRSKAALHLKLGVPLTNSPRVAAPAPPGSCPL